MAQVAPALAIAGHDQCRTGAGAGQGRRLRHRGYAEPAFRPPTTRYGFSQPVLFRSLARKKHHIQAKLLRCLDQAGFFPLIRDREDFDAITNTRHSREGGNPSSRPAPVDGWVPAFAGMTAMKCVGPPSAPSLPAPGPRSAPARSPCGSRFRSRSWLGHRPLGHRHRRPHAVEAADRIGMGDLDGLESSPPIALNRRISSACVSIVTPLITSRPAGAEGGPCDIDRVGEFAPPPMKTASGGEQAPQRLGRGALHDREAGHAQRRRALRRDPRWREPGRARSRWRGWPANSASIRCRPTPNRRRYPTATRPGRGLSAARVMARISRLVICPSCSNQSSGSPATHGMKRAPGASATSSATRLSGSMRWRSKSFAVASLSRSAGPPIASQTVIRVSPSPRPVSSAASFAGVVRPRIRRGCGRAAEARVLCVRERAHAASRVRNPATPSQGGPRRG